MDIKSPVSEIMTKYVKTLSPADNLWDAKVIFDRFNIHHIPIKEKEKAVGMISKSDFDRFFSGGILSKEEKPAMQTQLSGIMIRDVMTKKLITIRKKTQFVWQSKSFVLIDFMPYLSLKMTNWSVL